MLFSKIKRNMERYKISEGKSICEYNKIKINKMLDELIIV